MEVQEESLIYQYIIFYLMSFLDKPTYIKEDMLFD